MTASDMLTSTEKFCFARSDPFSHILSHIPELLDIAYSLDNFCFEDK